MLSEFKGFIAKGNVLDLAVAVIIGAAFGTIVQSLVNDVIMPPIGLVLGNVDFSNLFFVLKEGTPAGPYAALTDAMKSGAVTINYGRFINTIISFLIVSFAVFILVRNINRLRMQKEAAPPPPPGPSNEEKLLTEIRDILKNK